MNHILAIPAAICCVLVAYSTLNAELANKIKVLHIMGKPSDEEKNLDKRQVLLFSLTLGIICYGAIVMLFRHTGELINRLKMLVALVCLTGAACNDYREQRIPNIFPLAMAVVGLLCLAMGYLTSQNGAVSYIAGSLVAAVLVTACMSMVALLTKNGIGMGDIKLLGALALAGGIYAVGGTLFYGVIACSLAAIVLLILKKKTIKESLPFGPFIFIGYIVSIFTSFY